MISINEANQIPEALEAMRKEYQILSGKCWIEGNRRSKQDVIREARERGVEVHFSMVHGIIGAKGYKLSQGDPAINSMEEQYCWETVYSIRTTKQQPLQT